MIKLNDENIDTVCVSLDILTQGIKKYSTFIAGQEFEKLNLFYRLDS
jgi:hypothetical protein